MFYVDLVIMLISGISPAICIYPSVDAIYMYMYILDLSCKMGTSNIFNPGKPAQSALYDQALICLLLIDFMYVKKRKILEKVRNSLPFPMVFILRIYSSIMKISCLKEY